MPSGDGDRDPHPEEERADLAEAPVELHQPVHQDREADDDQTQRQAAARGHPVVLGHGGVRLQPRAVRDVLREGQRPAGVLPDPSGVAHDRDARDGHEHDEADHPEPGPAVEGNAGDGLPDRDVVGVRDAAGEPHRDAPVEDEDRDHGVEPHREHQRGHDEDEGNALLVHAEGGAAQPDGEDHDRDEAEPQPSGLPDQRVNPGVDGPGRDDGGHGAGGQHDHEGPLGALDRAPHEHGPQLQEPLRARGNGVERARHHDQALAPHHHDRPPLELPARDEVGEDREAHAHQEHDGQRVDAPHEREEALASVAHLRSPHGRPWSSPPAAASAGPRSQPRPGPGRTR